MHAIMSVVDTSTGGFQVDAHMMPRVTRAGGSTRAPRVQASGALIADPDDGSGFQGGSPGVSGCNGQVTEVDMSQSAWAGLGWELVTRGASLAPGYQIGREGLYHTSSGKKGRGALVLVRPGQGGRNNTRAGGRGGPG